MAGALAIAGGALVACGSPDAKFGNIKAGELPSGESWGGVYYNPVYGYLHMVEEGGNIVGRWKRTDGSHWGELSGTFEGNVAHYTWKEHQYGAVGPSGHRAAAECSSSRWARRRRSSRASTRSKAPTRWVSGTA